MALVRFRSGPWSQMAMVLAAAACWGLSGTVAEALFHRDGFNAGWLVSVRMLTAGVVLLGAARVRGQSPWEVWRPPGNWWRLLIFGIVALAGVQWTYLAAIAASNAPTATLLQYLGPLFLMGWVAVWRREPPSLRQWLAAVLALVGVALLLGIAGRGGPTVSVAAAGLGLASAILLAFYSWYPQGLLRAHGALPVVGTSMLVGGLAASAVFPVWQTAGQAWSWGALAMVAFVAVIGTVVPFTLFLSATRRIPPTVAVVLASAEPLAATLATVLWLHAPWTLRQSLGGLAIVGTVILLASSPVAGGAEGGGSRGTGEPGAPDSAQDAAPPLDTV